MVAVSRQMRVLMLIVIGVSVPEGLALLFGPPEWYTQIWGWGLTPMTARFTAGLYLSVALGFLMAWRETEWERVRITFAMLWSFSLVALAAALFAAATAPPVVVELDRPFTWVWFFLYIVSVIGGLYYHVGYARKHGVRIF